MTILFESGWLLPVLVAPFVGSFLGLLIERLPAGGKVAFARSACPACDHPLGLLDLVPKITQRPQQGEPEVEQS